MKAFIDSNVNESTNHGLKELKRKKGYQHCRSISLAVSQLAVMHDNLRVCWIDSRRFIEGEDGLKMKKIYQDLFNPKNLASISTLRQVLASYFSKSQKNKRKLLE